MTPYQLAIQQINQKYSGTTTTSAPPKPVGPIRTAVNAVGSAAKAVVQAPFRIDNAFQNFNNNLNAHLAQYGKNIVSGVKQAGQDLSNTFGGTNEQQVSGGFQAVGDVLKPAVMGPVNAAFKPLGDAWNTVTSKLNPVADFLSGQPKGTTQLKNDQAGQATAQAYTQWSQQHPEAAKNLEALSTIGQSGMAIAGATKITGKIPGVIQSGLDTLDSAIAPKIAPAEIPGQSVLPDKILQARIKDATPDYNENMVSENIKNPEGKITPRVNEGKGIAGKRTVNTSASELANAKELTNIKDYPENGTALQKTQSVGKAIGSEAENLKASLAAEDKNAPLVSGAKDQVYKGVFDNMNGDARDAFVSRGKGIEAQLGLSEPPSKTIVGRYGQDVADALGEYDGTRQGILDLRQKLDSIYEDARGKSAFGTEHRNALDEMHSAVRDYLNNELHTSTANTDVQVSLQKQTRLFRAKDVLDAKAEAEAVSKFSRYLQRHPMQRRIGVRGLMRVAIEVTGISLAAATINKLIKGVTSGK